MIIFLILGDSGTHLQSLNPLDVPSMHIDVDGGLIIDLADSKIAGFELADFKAFKYVLI